jgi:hypothetical protein
MAAKKTNHSFSLTLFDIYRKIDQNGPLPEPPTFAYAKDGATLRIPFLQPEEQADKSMRNMRNAFRRLYPLAEKTFKTERMFWTADANLLKELQGAWQVGKGPLSVRFQEAGAFLFEEEYLLVYLAVSPDMAETDNEHVAEAAVNMTNALSGRLNRKDRTEIVRKFKNDQAKESARNRFQSNEELPLIQGILGQALSLEDMFDTLAGPGWISMLCDRFLLKSLLVTPVDEAAETAPAYSKAEQDDLVRLARGMNRRNYLPPSLDALAGHVVPVQTFANVLFMAANEGVAGHVKPVPGQDFLHNQFVDRYRTGYTLLFVLAVYQHYRLIDLSRKLAEQTENPNERERIEKLREIRRDFAHHDLKYIITQPAFLSNAQQFYTGLRQGMNTGALVEKLRRSVTELDTLLTDAEKKQHEEAEFLLTILAECVALPYYLYHLLAHAIHCEEKKALWVTGIVTAMVVTKTVWSMYGRPILSRLQRLL